MKQDNLTPMVQMKSEVRMAIEIFRLKYKKVPKGINRIYEDMILSNDYEFVKDKYNRFFGYIKKSKRAKEKWDDEGD